MTPSEVNWIAETCVLFGCIPFSYVWSGGTQWLLLPFGWKPTAWVH